MGRKLLNVNCHTETRELSGPKLDRKLPEPGTAKVRYLAKPESTQRRVPPRRHGDNKDRGLTGGQEHSEVGVYQMLISRTLTHTGARHFHNRDLPGLGTNQRHCKMVGTATAFRDRVLIESEISHQL
ncbi:hypothetical protein J6590_047904 [Homalodisca vitripennis]|nr:hypothetical protein J6590_047904 [Homalodisca vitripennis]